MKCQKYVAALATTCLFAGCGGGGGGGVAAPVASLAVGQLDGKWSCDNVPLTIGQIASGDWSGVIQIAGAQYYSYIGGSPRTISFNKGIVLGPEKVSYGGSGNLGSQLVNSRQYKVVHLADKPGFAGYFISQDMPVGGGSEFSLGSDGKLKISTYLVHFPYATVYDDKVGTDGDQGPSTTTCTKI